jgi:hypothetical protein
MTAPKLDDIKADDALSELKLPAINRTTVAL